MKRSLFIKIFAGYFTIICMLSVSISFFSFRIIKHYHIKSLTGEMLKQGKTLLLKITPLLEHNSMKELDNLVKLLGSDINTRITVIDVNGVVLADSKKNPAEMENHKTRPEVIQAIYGSMGSSMRFSTTVRQQMLYVAIPVKKADRVSWVLRISLFLNDINALLGDLKNSIISIAAAATFICLVISFIVARKMTAPIHILSKASKRIASGDFNTRVFLKNNDELNEFADSFNYMTEKIRSLFEEVSFQKEEFNYIISSMHEGLMVLDRDGTIALTNESLKKITQTGDIRGKFYWEVLREPQFGDLIKKVTDGRQDTIEELTMNGRTFLCSTSFIEPKEKIIIIFLDISEIRNMERIKKDLVLNVSHELRTPLTAIKGFLETMEEEEVVNTSHRRYLEIIKRHTDRLINIVKDLMDLSKLEKEAALDLEEADLKELVKRTGKICEQALQQKNLSLKLEMEDEPVFIRADAFKLEQAFINLLDNAIKYTEKGGILISLKREDDSVQICVKDTGIGIGKEDLSRIFERFYVADKSRSRSLGGTGLGLSIVKHIVLLHNGTIDVQSTPGAGTRFIINLPLNA